MEQDELSQIELRRIFYSESKKRSRGEKKWVKWKPPKWAIEYDTYSFDFNKRNPLVSNKGKCSSEKLLQNKCVQRKRQKLNSIASDLLQSLIGKLLQEQISFEKIVNAHNVSDAEGSSIPVNNDIYLPEFIKPDEKLLEQSHQALKRFLPEGDCEDIKVVKLAESYYTYWRPRQVKVILLAESHVFTDLKRAFDGPGLDPDLMKEIGYNGPTDHLCLVYSLTYGENEAFDKRISVEKYNKNRNMGTPQFWSILAACSRGTNDTCSFVTKKCNKKLKTRFAADLLKQGGLSCKERLSAKLNILKDLKARGIWLIDTSLVGWYIPQTQRYCKSSVTNDVHKVTKERPPKNYKAPALKLSWESYTKHVVREAVNEGFLKLVLPIGMEVGATIGRERFIDVIGNQSDNGGKITLADPIPAPNAFIPGGYGQFYDRIAKIVHDVSPPKS